MIKIVRRINLSNLGDEFKGSFIDLNEPSIRQALAMQRDPQEGLLKYIETEFLEGMIWDGVKNSPIKAGEVLDLPLTVLSEISEVFLAQASAKSS